MVPAQLESVTMGASEDCPRKLGCVATLSKGISSFLGAFSLISEQGLFPSVSKCGQTALTSVPLFSLPAVPLLLLIQTY